MTRQAVINQMKTIYQLDPCAGSRWLETSDIEEAIDIACLRGRSWLNDFMVTWAPGAGYRVQDA